MVATSESLEGWPWYWEVVIEKSMGKCRISAVSSDTTDLTDTQLTNQNICVKMSTERNDSDESVDHPSKNNHCQSSSIWEVSYSFKSCKEDSGKQEKLPQLFLVLVKIHNMLHF